MTEFQTGESREPQLSTREYVQERMQWVAEAVGVLAGDSSLDPQQVLPAATEVRADGQNPNLTVEQEFALREIAGRFGIGGETDVHSGADHELIEGGLAWKIDAEAAIAQPNKSYIFAGTPHRPVNREDEIEFMKKRLGDAVAIGTSEYDIARQLAEAQEGFLPIDKDMIMPFGYDITNGFQLVAQQTGQLVHIGDIGDKPVLHLRVDRENYTDETDGKIKYRSQPDSAALMGFIADVLTAVGDNASTVGMNTSNTYSSRVIDAVRAGMARNRSFSVGMYGRNTISRVKNEAVAEPTAINQIPGELHTIHSKLQLLDSELKSR